MGQDDDGERIARLEERMRAVEEKVSAAERKVWGAIAVLLAILWQKVATVLGLGPG